MRERRFPSCWQQFCPFSSQDTFFAAFVRRKSSYFPLAAVQYFEVVHLDHSRSPSVRIANCQSSSQRFTFFKHYMQVQNAPIGLPVPLSTRGTFFQGTQFMRVDAPVFPETDRLHARRNGRALNDSVKRTASLTTVRSPCLQPCGRTLFYGTLLLASRSGFARHPRVVVGLDPRSIQQSEASSSQWWRGFFLRALDQTKGNLFSFRSKPDLRIWNVK